MWSTTCVHGVTADVAKSESVTYNGQDWLGLQGLGRSLGFGTELLTYLNRSGHVRCFNTQVDQTAYGKADEQPVIKTEVINKLEHVFHTEEYE